MWQVFFVTRFADKVFNVIGLSYLNAPTEAAARNCVLKFGEFGTIRMIVRRPNHGGAISGADLTRWLVDGAGVMVIV